MDPTAKYSNNQLPKLEEEDLSSVNKDNEFTEL